jgi:hypothetical protein
MPEGHAPLVEERKHHSHVACVDKSSHSAALPAHTLTRDLPLTSHSAALPAHTLTRDLPLTRGANVKVQSRADGDLLGATRGVPVRLVQLPAS